MYCHKAVRQALDVAHLPLQRAKETPCQGIRRPKLQDNHVPFTARAKSDRLTVLRHVCRDKFTFTFRVGVSSMDDYSLPRLSPHICLLLLVSRL
jgi:hypothetical protein